MVTGVSTVYKNRLNSRTTIGLRTATKRKLDDNRAPGQCYDGFICQLVDLWERSNNGRFVTGS